KTSHSSYRVPMLVFQAYPGIISGDTNPAANLEHGNLIAEVGADGFFSACVASDVLERSPRKGEVKVLDWPASGPLQKLGFDFVTNSFPSISIGWRNDLPMPLQLFLEDAFKNYAWDKYIGFTSVFQYNNNPIDGIIETSFWDDRWQVVYDTKKRID